jgi:hypothetical protein
MEQQVEQWKEYLDHKHRRGKRRFVLSPGQYGCGFMSKHGFYLDLYDVQERYKLGGNKGVHKIIEYEFINRESE